MGQSGFSHVNAGGEVHMVDVSQKSISVRSATARASVALSPATLLALRQGTVSKGDVLATVRIAAIQATKRTADLIPLCHPLGLEGVEVVVALRDAPPGADIDVTCRVSGRTGVEMEAMTGASVGALTLYDMCKSLDRAMEITSVALIEKTGGRSGTWRRV